MTSQGAAHVQAAIDLAGVDGCPAGWVVAAQADGAVTISIVPRFADIGASIVAVDMPIGLPDTIGAQGRGPEHAVRPLLGARQSSVFSVPSRAAVMAGDYGEACRLAAATSTPARKVSKQLFHIMPKIREVDAVLRADADTARRVHEAHPEVAFWRMNGERALAEPKKVKGTPWPAGLALRRQLLVAGGLPDMVVHAKPPRGAGADDLLDALACLWVARRIAQGLARPFPEAFTRDAFGLPMAIWA
jgi:predicted RNase H-like nuclease